MVDLTLPLLDLANLIKSRTVSVSEVVETALKQIALVHPSLNAVVHLAPDARARAKQADEDLAQGITPGPLHGIPFTVKDTFATAGLTSPLDARLRGGRTPAIDATAVARLRHAGAILVAKTNCPPAGHGTDTENAITGRTFNPYHLGHTPGGSSGGEAALVAAGVSPFGLGSDQSGGLRVPAHYCGVTTLKPAAGRVPNTGVYNQPGGLTDQRSQVGLIARWVADLALLMPLIIGADYEDAGVIPMPWPDRRA
ncbi:MAG TPA: amidase, partial [Caldilineaceae bacterium]|nr:amidase [Caldilineaceae bacterium]